MNILTFSLWAFGAYYVTWILYQAVMNLKRAKDAGTLPKPAYYLGLPVLYLGLLVDCLVNVIFVTPLFLELPREFLITQRLKRHFYGPDTWRKSLATWFAANLLDPFDPDGKHV